MPAQDVKIVDTEKPIDVKVVSDKAGIDRSKGSLAPTTTEQEDITKEGQRAINLIWETTQSRIALLVIRVALMSNGFVVVSLIVLGIVYKVEINATIVAVIVASLASINTISGIVIGFYFSRTNHQKIGGVSIDKQTGR